MVKKNIKYIYFTLFSILLLFVIFTWGDYLIKNKYITECFQNQNNDNKNSSESTKNTEPVNYSYNESPYQTTNPNNISLPLNTTYSCDNMCGPTARCSITGQQCTADIDCPGCQPYTPPLPKTNNCVPGDNDAGKLTLGTTPTYSTLTTDIGTQASLFTSDKFKTAPQANFGVNTWRSSFDKQQSQFNDKYKCNDYPHLMKYPNRDSTTGLFVQDGPLASNAYLH